MKKAVIITIGDELLIGQVIDTNSAWIAVQLNQIGIEVIHKMSIPDQKKDILEALDWAKAHGDVVLITGGIGPTKDDITKQTLCEYFNTELVMDQTVLKHVDQMMQSRGRSLNDLTKLQAMVPRSATIITNWVGTAPIIWFEENETIFVSMPGVPFEMKKAMESEVLLRLKKEKSGDAIVHRTLLVMGLAESLLAMRIESWESSLPSHISLAYLPAAGLVRLRITGHSDKGRQLLEKEIEELISKLRPLLEGYLVDENNRTIQEVLVEYLKTTKRTISTAESCTGGNIAHCLTLIPGVSAVYNGSIVTYSNSAKTNLLGVSEETLNRYGAVSEETVIEMVNGVCRQLNTEVGIAVSGIAGPEGGTIEKPVGTVWIAIKIDTQVTTTCLQLGTHRENNIDRATNESLMLTLQLLQNKS